MLTLYYFEYFTFLAGTFDPNNYKLLFNMVVDNLVLGNLQLMEED